MDIYYQCGNADINALFDKAGEKVMPTYKKMTDLYGVTKSPIDAKQLLKVCLSAIELIIEEDFLINKLNSSFNVKASTE